MGEIGADVWLLLSQAEPLTYVLTQPNVQLIQPGHFAQQKGGPAFINTNPEACRLYSEPAELLQRLFESRAGDADRATFVRALMTAVNETTASIVARTLAVTRHLPALSDAVPLAYRGDRLTLWRGVILTLRMEPGLFSEPDLDLLAEFYRELTIVDGTYRAELATQLRSQVVPTLPNGVTRIGRAWSAEALTSSLTHVANELATVITRVRYLRLGHALRTGANPALNEDRRLLVTRLQALGLPKELSDASDEIERRAANAISDTDVKSVMDLVRSFLEEVLEESSKRIAGKVGTPAPLSGAGGGNHYAPYRTYLRDAGILTPDDDNFLKALYSLLSNQGAHKLTAAPELLRVSHATVIEWSMLVVGRVQQYLA